MWTEFKKFLAVKSELKRCIEYVEYKEWCNYLQDKFLKKYYYWNDHWMKMKRIQRIYKGIRYKPLVYLKGVNRVQYKYYHLLEKMKNKQELVSVSSSSGEDTGSSSLISNNNDILGRFKNQIKKIKLKHQPQKLNDISLILPNKKTEKKTLIYLKKRFDKIYTIKLKKLGKPTFITSKSYLKIKPILRKKKKKKRKDENVPTKMIRMKSKQCKKDKKSIKMRRFDSQRINHQVTIESFNKTLRKNILKSSLVSKKLKLNNKKN